MHILLVCSGVVALAEIGDKTQLLALVLAARFKKPLPIILGILAATLANHGLAALVGTTLADWLHSDIFKWGLAFSFIAMGLWTLVPDALDGADSKIAQGGAFAATLISFFVVEIGDKTQIATVALAAQYQDIAAVTAGTTLGMMLANVPVVLIGEQAGTRLPMAAIRIAAACTFIALGAMTILSILMG